MMVRWFLGFGVVMLLGVSSASAQPFDDFEEGELAEEEPQEEFRPAPAPAARAEPAATPPPPSGGTDFDQTVGAWGFQITSAEAIGLSGGTFGLPMLGVRRWNELNTGWEAGGTLVVVRNGAAETTDIVFGGTFGYLSALGVYEHMLVFWEPQATLLVAVPNDGSDLTDDDPSFLLAAEVFLGTEVRLGMIGLPRLGMTAKIGGGLRILNDGSNTNFFFGTEGGRNASVDGLLEGTIGFVFYK